MARSDAGRLTEQEQRELLRLLEDEQKNMLVLIHSVPRPQLPGRPPQMRNADGNYVLLVHIAK
jgi:hypothetical protein